MEPNLRIFVNPEDTARQVVEQITRQYDRLKEEHDILDIQITLLHGCEPSIVEEVGYIITSEQIVEFRDNVHFDHI